MFSFNSAPIDTFRVMFNNADKTPVIVAADSIINIPLSISKTSVDNVVVYPSPTSDGKITIRMNNNQSIDKIVLYTIQGQKLNEWILKDGKTIFKHQIELPPTKGAYLIEIYTEKQTFSKKVLFE